MSDLYITPDTLISDLRSFEQVTVALLILLEHYPSPADLIPILEGLNGSINDTLIRAVVTHGEGVWGLPMLGAVDSSPC